MKKILVTGGAGFIGNHLCRELVAQGHKVWCLDNFGTGSKKNITDLMQNDNFILIADDITNKIYLEIDEIYNLACPASPTQYQNNPIKTITTCVVGAINVLNLATLNQAKVLQASTSEVYGNPTVHPQPESYWGNVNPVGPRSCYDEGKRCAETLFLDYHKEVGTKIKIARIFNTYGTNMQPDDGRVISNFIMQALSNKDITIYGDGTKTRSFCYVSDTVNGLIKLMDSTETGPINIGNPVEFSILDVANTVIRLTNSTSKIVFLPELVDDPSIRKPDISLAKQKLQWAPVVPWADGLRSTIEYFRSL